MALMYLLSRGKPPKKGEIDIQNFDVFIQKVKFVNKTNYKYNEDTYKPYIDSAFFDDKYNFLVYIQIQQILVHLGYIFSDPIIHFLFKKIPYLEKINSIGNKISLNSFFNTDDYFCNLVESIKLIGLNELPNSINRSKNFKEKNLTILYILHSIYPNVFSINQSLETEEDKFNVLKTIIDFCFNDFDYIQNFEDSSLILEEYNVQIKNISDLLTPKTIINLLYILTYKKLPQFEVTIDNFDEYVEEIKLHYINNKCFDFLDSIFINSSFFLNDKYNFLIHIQIYNILSALFQVYDEGDPIIHTIYSLYPCEFFKYDIKQIDDFFNSGFQFPRFVSLVLNEGEKIPGVLTHVRNKDDAKRNNSLALQFLIKNAPDSITIQKIETPEEQYQILEEILTKIVFNINKKQIRNKCERFIIGEEFNILSKLYVLKLIQKIFNPDDYTDIIDFKDMYDKYSKEDVSILFINDNFFYEKYLNLIYIQFHLIFGFNDHKNKDQIIRLLSFLYPFMSQIYTKITIDSFFNNGYFLQFVHEVLQASQPFQNEIEEITSELDIQYNNKVALKNINIDKQFQTKKEKFDLLKTIIFKKVFDIDPNSLYFVINQYFRKFNSNDCNDDKLINPASVYRFVEKLKISNLRLFIDSSFFSKKYKFLVYIQIFLLLRSEGANKIIARIHKYDDFDRQNDVFDRQNDVFDNQYEEFDNQLDEFDNQYDEFFHQYGKFNQYEEFDNQYDEFDHQYDEFDHHNDASDNGQSYEYQCFLTRDPHYYLNSNNIDMDKFKTTLYNSDSPPDIDHQELAPSIIKRNLSEETELSLSYKFDYLSDDDKDEGSTKNMKDKLNSFQDGFKMALLKTINIIGKRANLHFNSLTETVQNDSISKFVVSFLGLKYKGYLTSDKKIINFSNASNNDIINYLRKHEPKFGILVFDFSNEEFAESSAILFYTTFLNTFFLKETKRNFYERSLSMINASNNIHDHKNLKFKFNEKNEFKMLTNPRTFHFLLSFVGKFISKRSHHYNRDYLTKLFKKFNIPQILNKEFLKDCTSQKKIPDVIYYQIQLIFNVFDSYPASRVYQIFISIIYTLKKIKVPKVADLIKSIKSKIASRIITQEKVDKNKKPNQNEKKAVGWFNTNKLTELDKSRASYYLSNLKRSNYNLYPSFVQRLHKDYVIPKQKSIEVKGNMKSTKIMVSEKYWNSFDINISYDEGVLYNKIDVQSENNWKEEINAIIEEVKQKKSDLRKVKNLQKKMKKFSDISSDQKSCFYKFFIYNEEQEKWTFNEDSFNQLEMKKNMANKERKTPLVLFINSHENDSVSVVSKFIKHVFPDLDENENKEQIFVYGICDKSLSHFDYYIEQTDNDTNQKQLSQNKPIFLLVHVPKTKQNHPNIKKILLQIYSFLSYICDIEIVILDKKYYTDQIELISKLNNLYSKKIIEESLTLQRKSIFENNNNNNDNDKVVIIDNDFSEEEEKEEIEEKVEEKSYLLKAMPIDISKKSLRCKPDIIFLLNDSISGDYEKHEMILNQHSLCTRIFSKIKGNRYKCHLIDIDELVT